MKLIWLTFFYKRLHELLPNRTRLAKVKGGSPPAINRNYLYAALKDKTMTQVMEELIDSLEIPEIDKSSTTLVPVKP